MNKKYFYRGLIAGILVPLLSAVIFLYFFLRPPDISFESLQLRDLQNNLVNTNSFKGKQVVVNFWATWCAPCIKELPDLLKAQDSLRPQVIFVFVSDESIDTVRPYLAKRNFNGHFYCTPLSLVDMGLKVRPTTYFYDENGKIVDKHSGPVDYPTLIERFKK